MFHFSILGKLINFFKNKVISNYMIIHSLYTYIMYKKYIHFNEMLFNFTFHKSKFENLISNWMNDLTLVFAQGDLKKKKKELWVDP